MFECRDCNVDTSEIDEYPYMVHDELWKQYGVKSGMLCIGCLEQRMGRRLTASDFNSAPCNNPSFCWFSASDRMLNRLGKVA